MPSIYCTFAPTYLTKLVVISNLKRQLWLRLLLQHFGISLFPNAALLLLLLLLLMTFIRCKLRHAANAPSQLLRNNAVQGTGKSHMLMLDVRQLFSCKIETVSYTMLSLVEPVAVVCSYWLKLPLCRKQHDKVTARWHSSCLAD